MPDHYLDKNGVLKNLLGITNPQLLQIAEADFVTLRAAELLQQPNPTVFNLAYLKSIHHSLFQDVYEWAGVTRAEKTTIANNDFMPEPLLIKDKSFFAPSQTILLTLEQTFEVLAAKQNLRGLTQTEFVIQAAQLFYVLNFVHPFREGNGRTQRIFMTQLAMQAGHPLDWTVISQERIVAVCIDAQESGNTLALRRLFDEITNPTRILMLKEAIGFMESQEINWNQRYLATALVGREYEGVVAASSLQNFILMTSEFQIIVCNIANLPINRMPDQSIRFTIQEK
jgi:cell filamentation protein